MEIELIRTILSDDFTEGELRINGHFFCHTLEDRVRRLPAEKKIPGLTAIPAGTYRVTVSVSPKFGRYLPLAVLFRHKDTPGQHGRRHFRLHPCG